MRKRRVIAGLLALAVVAGCAGVKRITPESPVFGLVVDVREFNVNRTHVTSFDGATDSFGLQVAQAIAQELRERGVEAQVLRSGTPSGKVVVDGDVTLIDGGSRALRYWIGFGAGAAIFGVH